MKKIKLIVIVIFGMLVLSSCNDYLDVVPDNIATIEDAFKNRIEALNFLHGCYSYLPDYANIDSNPGLVSSDETCLFENAEKTNLHGWDIARGLQNTEDPLMNYWDGINGGKPLFRALRDCNIFLENIDKPFDLTELEKRQWVAEIKVLKAYYHFYLMRLYGPIPIIKKNLPISTSIEGVARFREPVDSVAAYIVNLIDEALPDLLPKIEDPITNQGRITQSIALSIKAETLITIASPLFNGNKDYEGFVDSRGRQLISTTYEPAKWDSAASALKAAIDMCHVAGHSLYTFIPPVVSDLSDSTIIAMGTRGAVTERWNEEIIWGSSSSTSNLQWLCHPAFALIHTGGAVGSILAPSLNVVDDFYTKNGVPMDEDNDWQGIDSYKLTIVGQDMKYYMEPGYTTINMHINREPRFYGNLFIDGGTLYGDGHIIDDADLNVTKFRMGSPSSIPALTRHSDSGYLVKKLINYQTSIPDNSGSFNSYRYAWPIIRLGNLYLLYAEALNEVKDIPDAEVYEYIDKIRFRSGLKGVVESWSNYSINPDKPKTKEGMRKIIQRERMIEMAFEGERTFDLNRWKLSEEYMNKNIRGWSVFEKDPELFYKVEDKYKGDFTLKNYLWPIRQHTLLENNNLVQNPGW